MRLTTALLCALAAPAFAAESYPVGGKATLTVEITVDHSYANDITQGTAKRTFEGRCTLSATDPLRADLMSGEINTEGTEGWTAKAGQMEQQAQAAGVDDFSAQLQREMAACGDNTACQMAAAQRAMADPRFQAGQDIGMSGAAEANRAEATMLDTNYQELIADSCTGRVVIEEQHTITDITVPGGPETITVKGERTLPEWEARMRGDFKSDQTALFLQGIETMTFPATSNKRGLIEREVTFLPPAVAWGVPIGPKPGFMASGAERLTGEGSTTVIEWTLTPSGG